MAGSRARSGGPSGRALRVLFGEGAMSSRSDADLVRVFNEGHAEAAEAAFEAIMARHGSMVLGVCRRITGDEHAAEDAFQAVFLILARKARSVQVDDSLGRWLHGVARWVARRARSRAARPVPSCSAADRWAEDPATAAVRAEVQRMVGREVARLPRKYREAVALCHLDGLSHDRAAEALGLPVGTVRSRLSRARDLLRARLVRQGLAPAALAAWLSEPPSEAAVSRALLHSAASLAASGASAAAPPAVAALAHLAARGLTTARAATVAAALVSVGFLAVASRPGEEPTERPTSAPVLEVGTPAPSLDERFHKIVKEYDDARQRVFDQAEYAATESERWKILSERYVDEAPFAKRVVDLAAEHPGASASRDALIWVVDKPHRTDAGAYGDEVSRAVTLLIQHHADDPETARLGLGLHNVFSRRRDAFLESVYANAKGREAKGLARLALARYLEAKAPVVAGAHRTNPPPPVSIETYDDKGQKTKKTVQWSNEELGYRVQLRMLDADAVRRQSEQLYEEVAADYADVPYITTRDRNLERLLKNPPTNPKEREEHEEIKRYLNQKKGSTLGQVASGRLDAMRNLVVGKPAPDFEGVGADGKPIRLSDFRGKVVVLDFWFSSCGPCLRELPDARKLTTAMKGRPFTLLGVVGTGDEDEPDARKVLEAEKIAWPNVLTGGRAIADRYHVERYPSHVVVDARGVIRAKGIDLADPGAVLEPLVNEAEASQSASGGPRR